MQLSRRQLLQAGAVAGAGILVHPDAALAARTVAGQAGPLTMFSEQLPTLAELGVLDLRAGGATELWMRNAEHSFHSQLGPTNTFTYRAAGASQTYLGPVIIAQRGTPFALTVHNQLGAHPLAFAVDTELVPPGSDDATAPRTSTHLHGGNTRPGSDGGPEQVFSPTVPTPTTTTTPRMLPDSGTTTMRWALPASTSTPDWRAATSSGTPRARPGPAPTPEMERTYPRPHTKSRWSSRTGCSIPMDPLPTRPIRS
jgi:FtsP/CotA-like multicopper oxidase with cupredoxin domain